MVEILAALTGDIKSWGILLFNFSYLAGMTMVIVGLLGMVGTSATQKGLMQGVPIPALIKTVIVGSLLIVIHEVLDVGTQTVFNQDSRQLLDYNPPTGTGFGAQMEAIVSFAFSVLWFIGLIAVLRGMFIVGSFGRGGASDSGIGTAAIFFFFGLALVNLDITLIVAANTFAAAGNESGLAIAEEIRKFIPQ